jgi:CDI immunity protein
MKTTDRLPFMQWASIHRTGRFISIQPLSGYRRALREDDGYVIYLPPDASDDVLGRALLEALDRSRFIWPDDEPEFFEWERYMRCYRNWQKDFMHRYGYKTKRDAYKSMDWCEAKRSAGTISIEPHKHDKPEYFSDLPADKTVILPETRDAATAGAALKLALDRCE